jgi:quercetin dioxygenase-like cupin family protein
MKHALVCVTMLVLASLTDGLLAGEPIPGQHASGIKVTQLMSTSSTVLGAPIEYPQTSKPKVTALKVEMAPGQQTGWHMHPYPAYGYILSGELTVQVQGGNRLHYGAGDAVVEVVGTPHNGINAGDKPVRFVVFFTGKKGQPYTMPSRER